MLEVVWVELHTCFLSPYNRTRQVLLSEPTLLPTGGCTDLLKLIPRKEKRPLPNSSFNGCTQPVWGVHSEACMLHTLFWCTYHKVVDAEFKKRKPHLSNHFRWSPCQKKQKHPFGQHWYIYIWAKTPCGHRWYVTDKHGVPNSACKSLKHHSWWWKMSWWFVFVAVLNVNHDRVTNTHASTRLPSCLHVLVCAAL